MEWCFRMPVLVVLEGPHHLLPCILSSTARRPTLHLSRWLHRVQICQKPAPTPALSFLPSPAKPHPSSSVTSCLCGWFQFPVPACSSLQDQGLPPSLASLHPNYSAPPWVFSVHLWFGADVFGSVASVSAYLQSVNSPF